MFKLSHIRPSRVQRAVTIIICFLVITPIVAFASWWNPLSWFHGWFGIFSTPETTESTIATTTTSIEENNDSVFLAQDDNTYTKATSAEETEEEVVVPNEPPPPPPSKLPPKTSSPTPIPKPPTPTPRPSPTSPTAPKNIQTGGVINFYGNNEIRKRSAGTATSSISARIWFPSTSTKVTISQKSANGISLKATLPKTGPACKVYPCTLTNVISVTSGVKEGTYSGTMTVVSGSSTAIGTFSIVVLPPEPIAVQLSVSGPVTVQKNVNGNVSKSNTILVQLLRGTPEKLTMTQSNFPHGITGKTTLGSCTPPCMITNSVSVSNAAETGSYSMTVHAVGLNTNTSASYNVNVGYSSKFGMHFEGEKRTFNQNQNPTEIITMDYPFDLLLDGGSPETAEISFKPVASTSVQFSQTSCNLPCKGINAHIVMQRGMKAGTYNIAIQAIVNRTEDDGKGGTKLVKYTDTWTVPVKIIAVVY